MITSKYQELARRKQRIQYRLRAVGWRARATPMFTASNIQYDLIERVHGLKVGGIGMMHSLVRHTGLVEAIDRAVHVLKVHLPYHESDHVLGIAYNILCGGTCLQDIELRQAASLRRSRSFAVPLGTPDEGEHERHGRGRVRLEQEVASVENVGFHPRQSSHP